MTTEIFSEEYIDDIEIDPLNNYFTPVWDRIFDLGIKPINLLDVGCGNGLFTLYPKIKTKCKITGIDGSSYALEKARHVGFDELHLSRDLNYEKLPFVDGTFDFVVCKDLLEHLLHPEFILSEIRRVLMQDGYLLLHTPNHLPIYGRVKFLLTNQFDTFIYFPGSKRWNFPHIRFFDFESINELITLYKFKVFADYSDHFPKVPFLTRFRLGKIAATSLAKWSASNFSEGFCFLLKK